MPPRKNPPAFYLPPHCQDFAAADERHFLPLGVRRACSRAPGWADDGSELSIDAARTALVSALFAALRFTDMWDYMLFLDAVPEKDPEGLRKAPSRWGAVFVRAAGVQGVTDEGNKFYSFVVALLEYLAVWLGRPALTRLHGKTNTAKVEERAGDYVEAVLGRAPREKHLAAGGTDTGYDLWTDLEASNWAVDLSHTDPADRSAGRMLQVCAAVQDFTAAVRLGNVLPDEFSTDEWVQFVFQENALELVEEARRRVSPAAARSIAAREPGAPAKRRRSVAGLVHQAQRRRHRGAGRAGPEAAAAAGTAGSAGGSAESTDAAWWPPAPGWGESSSSSAWWPPTGGSAGGSADASGAAWWPPAPGWGSSSSSSGPWPPPGGSAGGSW